jgi:hypothetical protein
MARLRGLGAVQPCSELRACGRFVCEYETLYPDDREPMEMIMPDEAPAAGAEPQHAQADPN